jgi:SprT protein
MTAVVTISPIPNDVQQTVTDEVQRYLDMASSLYHQSFEPIEVLFDLKGKAAGMYRVKSIPSTRFLGLGSPIMARRVIRFNPWLFAKYPKDSWDNTVPHEVAHYLVDCLYGLRNIKPHGKEWQKVMLDLGAEPIVRAAYDLSGVPVRKVSRYPYQCQCRDVFLSSYRHKKIQQRLQSYRCRDCRKELVFMPASNTVK